MAQFLIIFLLNINVFTPLQNNSRVQTYGERKISKDINQFSPKPRHLLFKQQFMDLKNLKNWKKDYFNKWIGGEQSKLYITFPEVMTSGIQKTYAGFWGHKIINDEGDKALLITGDYEFTYYKFTGYDAKRNRHSYKFYKLRLNGETKLADESNFRLLLRDMEIQQSNFEENFSRGTIGLGYYRPYSVGKYFTMGMNIYVGGAIQANIASYFPGIEEQMESVTGFSTTSGIEMKFRYYRLIGYIKYQFSFLNPDSMFNRTTIRLSVKNVFFSGDYIWIQIDSQFPTGAHLLTGNMFFVNYLKKF